jgi:hypothetical protein
MSAERPSNDTDLGGFLETVGRSFSQAQESLSTGLGLPTSFVIADAELEVKAAVNVDAQGRTVMQTLSAQEIRAGGIDPGVLSTIRIGFAVTPQDVGDAPLGAETPRRGAEDVIEDVRSRPDVAALAKILGDLDFQATYVPEGQRWLVVAHDAKGRLVRETVLADVRKEGDIE